MNLGDRMKYYEHERKLYPLLPICVRLDGKAFHSFTRGLKRPFDERFHEAMVRTTIHLVELTNACIGYTQSDEISLVLPPHQFKVEAFMGGKVHKIVSLTAAAATLHFNALLPELLPAKAEKGSRPLFDSRAWTVPLEEEAANALLWREQDATRNSIQGAGRAHFPHKHLHGKSGPEIQDMLHEIGINWNDYATWMKRGTYVRRTRTSKPFTAVEIAALPPKHQARTDPTLVVERSTISRIEMPPFGKVANRAAVIFEGAEPVLWADTEKQT